MKIPQPFANLMGMSPTCHVYLRSHAAIYLLRKYTKLYFKHKSPYFYLGIVLKYLLTLCYIYSLKTYLKIVIL